VRNRRVVGPFLAIALALVGAAPALAQDSEGAAADDKAAKLAILEAYVDALVDGDFTQVPMTEDVTFQNPYMSEPISGIDTVQAYEEANFSSTISGIVDDAVTYMIDGDDATAIFVLEMTKGWLVPTADYFTFEDGKISSITPFFDTAIFATTPPVAE
jgi:hypothetical protein